MNENGTAGGPARILVIGAHPDDCEVKVGGTACLWARAGHRVRFVSATDGGTGHHRIGGIELVRRRAAEAARAAEILGVESEILPIPNGGIVPSLEYRGMFIRMIRRFRPHLIVTHRPWDYHPDHRNTSLLVQDSAYLVTVPNNCPDTPALDDNPVIAYMADTFQKPCPFDPAIVIDVTAVMDTKLDALHAHVSQMYEWIPFNQGVEAEVPAGDAERRTWLAGRRSLFDEGLAERFRPRLVERYGPQRAADAKYAEAFEICEYGGRLDDRKRDWLFGGL
ncbi:MAG: PIG-L family deacetylase [Planctomycetes bacterium]|nr:PIG-L family deacetylase [Planctomycetota bacterium]